MNTTFRSLSICFALGGLLSALACGSEEAEPPEPAMPAAEPAPAAPPAPAAGPEVGAVRDLAGQMLGALPEEASSDTNPVTEEKIVLGRTLYYDPRLSKNHDISCNSCHQLDRSGVDGEATSPGHQGQRGDRNSPTVYNAALHITQFWDGRAADVEEQAKGPVLNPVEMAMPDEATVVAVLQSIPGYQPLFAAAFPGGGDPITYDNMASAIGAFERRLMTDDRLDAFLAGDDTALSGDELRGLDAFLETGCTVCHNGAAIGGGIYQKLGLANPYDTEDTGRMKVTNQEADRFFFKVPSLRNIAQTGPYFHDGSVATLDEAIRLMAHHQLDLELTDAQISDLAAFLGALSGTIDAAYIAEPALPESGPDTPAPDPS